MFYSLGGEIKEFDLPTEYEKNKQYFGGAVVEGDKILFTSFCGKNLEFDMLKPEKTYVYEPSIYYYKMLQNGGKVICEYEGKTFYIDPVCGKRELKLLINGQEKIRYIKNNLADNYILTESNDMQLIEFIEMLNI